jgi:hypothetical protein
LGCFGVGVGPDGIGIFWKFFFFFLEWKIFFLLNVFMMDQGFLQGMAVERTWSSARGGVRSGILLGLAPCSSHMYIALGSMDRAFPISQH